MLHKQAKIIYLFSKVQKYLHVKTALYWIMAGVNVPSPVTIRLDRIFMRSFYHIYLWDVWLRRELNGWRFLGGLFCVLFNIFFMQSHKRSKLDGQFDSDKISKNGSPTQIWGPVRNSACEDTSDCFCCVVKQSQQQQQLGIPRVTGDPACLLKCYLKIQGWTSVHRKPYSSHFSAYWSWIELICRQCTNTLLLGPS